MAKLTFGHLMAKIYKLRFIKNTRLYAKYSLVFFLLFLSIACKKRDNKNIALIWQNGRATGIQIPQSFIRDVSKLRVEHSVKIIVSGTRDKQAVLGNFTLKDDLILFESLIPLLPGLSYDILQDNKLIGHLQVPFDKDEKGPKIIAIYPEADTVPENLLKIYFHFSKPMLTGHAIDHIYILDAHKDTMRNVFLDLQPELWDTSKTTLTLWLDPGRIKRGLVLNKELGNPLKKSERYQLVVSRQWKDNRGLNLSKIYTKQFTAGARDEQAPDMNNWQLTIPKAGSNAPLIIDTKEPLDHYLLQESIQITTNSGVPIKGTSEVSANDHLWKFTPAEPWKAQTYKVKTNSRLEDLAGNNLNRVFDRDITKDKQSRNNAYYERSFAVSL